MHNPVGPLGRVFPGCKASPTDERCRLGQRKADAGTTQHDAGREVGERRIAIWHHVRGDSGWRGTPRRSWAVPPMPRLNIHRCRVKPTPAQVDDAQSQSGARLIVTAYNSP